MSRSLQQVHRLITFVTNDKVRFGLLGPIISVGTLPVQIGCTEHIMTITRSDRKYFAGG